MNIRGLASTPERSGIVLGELEGGEILVRTQPWYDVKPYAESSPLFALNYY